MGFALLFTVDIDRLLNFYKEVWGIVIVGFFGIINPLLILFGFSCTILPEEVIGTSYCIFRKRLKVSDLSHVLYQPTWRGVSSLSAATNMRSLHIVKHSGGWKDTISLTNGLFREEDLADIARRLKRLNPSLELDEHAKSPIKRYEI
jgi:hypothetical protein